MLVCVFGLLSLCALLACKSKDVSTSYRHQIEKADTLWAFQVDGYPTKGEEQRKDRRYLYDYEVKKVHPLLSTEMADMKSALLDSTTFDTAAVKSCPMIAQYAIAIRNHGKSPVAVVISPAPCGKALLFNSKRPGKPTCMELRTGNRLEALLTAMW